MADPRYTVLSATYNQAAYLEEMVDSVLGQTLDDLELVIVDDGSTDETPAVLDRLVQRLPADRRDRVVVHRTENSGQTAAFEAGLRLARGRYVCLLDSDDRFHPTKLEIVDRAVRAHPEAGMVMHPLAVIDPEGRETGVIRPRAATLSSGDVRAVMRRSARHVAPGASGLVFRRDVIDRLFPAPTARFPFAADAYLSFGAACLEPVLAVDEPLADYRMHPTGQYFRRMLSPEGLRRQVEFQEVVAATFGLAEAGLRNSHWARNRFASAMLDGPWGRRLAEYRALIAATLTDPAFGLGRRVALAGFWTTSLLAGPRLFPRLWLWFQRRQTGWHRVARTAADAVRPGLATSPRTTGAHHPAAPATGVPPAPGPRPERSPAPTAASAARATSGGRAHG